MTTAKRGRPVRGVNRGMLAIAAVAGVALSVTLPAVPSAYAGARASVATDAPSPAAPRVLFDEGFENTNVEHPLLLTRYTGVNGTTYTAAPGWLTNCNGMIVSASMPNTDRASSGCGVDAYGHVRQLASVLGTYAGGDAAHNHAVTAYTEDPPGTGPGLIQFQTASDIPLPDPNRFLTFSVDVAAISCDLPGPRFQFSLAHGDAVTPLGAPVDGCAGRPITAPPLGGVSAGEVRVSTATSNGSFLWNGGSLGIRMSNDNGGWFGNDAAIDNLRVLDVTPAVSQTFAPAAVTLGQESTWRVTITNTNELAQKSGFALRALLPPGVEPVADATPTSDCGGNVAVADGALTLSGSRLAAGKVSCTVGVRVRPTAVGSVTQPASAFSGLVGLTPPTDAALSVAAAVVASPTPTPTPTPSSTPRSTAAVTPTVAPSPTPTPSATATAMSAIQLAHTGIDVAWHLLPYAAGLFAAGGSALLLRRWWRLANGDASSRR